MQNTPSPSPAGNWLSGTSEKPYSKRLVGGRKLWTEYSGRSMPTAFSFALEDVQILDRKDTTYNFNWPLLPPMGTPLSYLVFLGWNIVGGKAKSINIACILISLLVFSSLICHGCVYPTMFNPLISVNISQHSSMTHLSYLASLIH